MKHIYYYDEYYKDISAFAKRHKVLPNTHVVAVHPQALPVGVHLANLIGCDVSIVRVVDSKAEWVLNNTGGHRLFPRLLCIDTIYNEGVFEAIKQLPEIKNNPDYTLYAIFGHDNDLKVHYTHELIYKDVVFPWQREIVKNDLVM